MANVLTKTLLNDKVVVAKRKTMQNDMADHKITATEEMYLIAIIRAQSGKLSEPVSISLLAKSLGVQPVSANQMVRKMATEGWLEYIPYKGVLLSSQGEDHARRVLRMRRLWEVFLVRELEVPLDDAEKLACDLEHHISEDVAERLNVFLGHPKVCFHGEPILNQQADDGDFWVKIPLTDFAIGASGTVFQLPENEAVQKFLIHEGIRHGVSVQVAAIGNHGDLLIEAGSKSIYLSTEVASNIMLRKEI